MKKLILLALITYCTSCANPEDRATGNPDSTSFNNNENVLNSQPGVTDPGSQSAVEMSDSSSSPATIKGNTNSATNGTNRGYGGGRDSGR